jgi:hypothetical protein
VVDLYGRAALRQGGTWRELPGIINDLAFAPDGTLWALGGTTAANAHQLLRWAGTDWAAEDATGTRLAIAADGHPVLVDTLGGLQRRSPTGWTTVPGTFTAVTTAPDGTLYAIGTDRLGYALTPYGRQIIAGHLADLAAGPSHTWAIKEDGRILRTL